MKAEPEVNLELAKELGLTEEEFAKIIEFLGRMPNYTELGMYSVMWSEHCSYKNSIAMLKTLPRSGGPLLVSAGEENAGLVDIGDGWAVAFKIESHNHPSAIEPYQGAATGVGGILRDIFTMGARPIAILDSLRFGDINDDRVKYLVKGVVRGIGDYGNCFGVPTVGGETFFDPSYNANPLVNAMAVGLVRHNRMASATAKGEGNPVLIVGAATGRDGIHGATFASEEISEASEEKRPSVQVGDPFTEKLLMEATLEIIKEDLIVGIQDMGAAGITCSTTEMSAHGSSGMEIDLDLVPKREKGMSAYEILLSESQERMLVVAKKGCEDRVKEIFRKWDLPAINIGRVTSDGFVKILYEGKEKAVVPADSLVLGGGAPVYHRESRSPAYLDQTRMFDPDTIPVPRDMQDVFLALWGSPNIAGKQWVFEQYDTSVRTNTVLYPGGDAAVVRVKETKKALAMSTDCNSRYVYLNPKKGAMIAVAEAARNVVCTGAKPLAITNCLNFGNPYKPEIYYQFKEAVLGIGEACRAFGTPVTGGNVSFYNENPTGAVYPTPVIGMVGLIDNPECIVPTGFQHEGDSIILLGINRDDLSGSEYLARIHGVVAGDAPYFDIEEELKLQAMCLEAIQAGMVCSAHDISDGGLLVALAECCILNKAPIAAVVTVIDSMRRDALYFGESQSRIILSVHPPLVDELMRLAEKRGVPSAVIGTVGGSVLEINSDIAMPLDSISKAYSLSLPRLLK
ncbi:MAG: phosphoribosylformylglycinamidine synthase subunit PurL [Chlorobi bacterium]|nr:phosphoribosylformylglycinamidine synthase subunit PurL [Chlorobiota bacterium]